MPKLCSGKFNEDTLQKIKDKVANGCIRPTGTCAVCGRENLVAEPGHGQWYPESHSAPQGYRPKKPGPNKRLSK